MLDRSLCKNHHLSHIEHLQHAYAQIIQAHQLDCIVIHSGSPHLRSSFDDQFWPLRPVPAFQHWVPVALADSFLVIKPAQKPQLIYLGVVDFWETQPEISQADDVWLNAFNVVRLTHRSELGTQLPAVGAHVAWIGEAAGLQAVLSDIPIERINPKTILHALDHLRSIKTDYEVVCLRAANQIAAVGHEQVRQLFLHEDLSELELHLAYLRATAQDDPETPYKNIVALGKHAATLHHVSYSRMRDGRATSLLLDAGATVNGYASDITRSYVKGQSTLFAELIAGVETLQQKLCSEIKVGMLYEDLHDRSHWEVAELLCHTNISRMSIEATVQTGCTRVFFPHGLGHSLGLQCHDVGCADVTPRHDNPFLRNTSRIAPGQVFTIEPGIYFIQSLLDPLRSQSAVSLDWAQIEKLALYGGIRIEDDVYITDGKGHHTMENLTRSYLPQRAAQ